jgi:hypothetical protein
MSMPQSWTLSKTGTGVRVKPEEECSLMGETLIRVVESEPVLDLLVRLHDEHDYRTCEEDLMGDVEALLREHGRLS